MATSAYTSQSVDEIVTYTIDFTADLPTGVTVSSAVVTHTPPSGSATIPSVAVSSPNVSVQIGPLAVTGRHVVQVLAYLSNDDVSEFDLYIEVE